MKLISKEKLIEILQSYNVKDLSIDDLLIILQKHGEDWHIKDGVFKKHEG